MILSLEWLSEFVDTAGIDTKQFCDRMTATGSKVEGFEVLGDDILNVKVGRIVGLRRHENSDHLQIATLTSAATRPFRSSPAHRTSLRAR